MSFVSHLKELPLQDLLRVAATASPEQVAETRAKSRLNLTDFARLISPAAENVLEGICRQAHQLTRRRFGNTMRLFAPLYLSNECVNNCKYCGFSRDNSILRVTLTAADVVREGQALVEQGFRNILLVAGEHPKYVSEGYLADCIRRLRQLVPDISLEIGPMETEAYRPLVEQGAEGLVVYQETYDRSVYSAMHTSGPKRDFDFRLETPERGYAAGFRRLGIGALHGLADWRSEVICTAAHAEYLLRHCWKAQLTVSLPRLRPCAGTFQPPTLLPERALAQLVCALRLFLPDVGLVLSTRESAAFRNGLIPLGITLMSAGSHTEPGGYTGAGRDKLHHTQHGRIIALEAGETEQANGATGQFQIADERSPQEVAALLRRMGYDPVWKDWDTALNA